MEFNAIKLNEFLYFYCEITGYHYLRLFIDFKRRISSNVLLK